MIVAKMATMPSRAESLPKTLKTLLPQVDSLEIYLNGFDSCPNTLNHSKITCFMSQEYSGDLGDLGKIFKMPKKGVVFLVDDDLAYPYNYVDEMQKSLAVTEAIVGVHGVILKKPVRNYFEDRTVLHFNAARPALSRVDVLGTGTVAFDAGRYHKLFSNMLNEEKNMLDCHLAVAARLNNTDLWSVPRPPKWINPVVNDPESLWNTRDRKAVAQTAVLHQVPDWR
jgi:hypothetical protein